jgi:hypothetical protein
MRHLFQRVALAALVAGCVRLAPGAEPDSLLDGMLQTLRAGRSLTAGEVSAAIGAFDR